MERRANPSTQLEIDQAILDYLVYSAIKAFIYDYRTTRRESSGHVSLADTILQLVDSFLEVFKSLHPGEHGNKQIQMRLRLLRFTTLFCSRFNSAHIEPSQWKLQSLRKQSRQRRKALGPRESPVDILDGDLADNAADTAGMRIPERDIQTDLYGSAQTISLISTLPSFMALSAAQSVQQGQPVSDLWMILAGGYMAHAALEQSLVHGVRLVDALKEAFAWHFDPECPAQEGTDDWAINAMFIGEDGEVGWDNIRNEHIRMLIPPEGISLQAHAKTLLANELSLDAFEEHLMSFIEGVLFAHPNPMYAQLESGKVDGLSQKETQAMREAVHIM